MLLTMEGISLPDEIQQENLEKLASAFFRTKGTVTHALKVVVEQLNERLIARSMRLQGKGLPAIGIFNAVVLHGSSLFFAHAGPTSTFLVTNTAVERFTDSSGGSRGLGMSKAVNIRYYRAEVQPNDLVLISAKPPSSWTAKNLIGSPQLDLDQLRYRLLSETPADLRFVVLRLTRGKGVITVAPLVTAEVQPTVSPYIPPAAAPTAEIRGPAAEALPQTPTDIAVPVAVSVEEPPGFPPHLETEELQMEAEQAPWTAEGVQSTPPTQSNEAAAVRRLRRQQAERRTRHTVAAALNGRRTTRQKAASFLRRFLPRVLPGEENKLPAISPTWMVFIAIAVPLVIVAAASTAYIRSGRNEQHRTYLAQSQILIEQANAQSDLTLKRVNLDAALEWIVKAESYAISEDSSALRKQVQSALDELDGIRRMNLELALPGGFDSTVHITRMVSSQAEDLFLLDANSGRVFRLIYTRPGYEVDYQFICGPGIVGGLIIGPLVDIAAAPIGNIFSAAVIGLDEFGNILYCGAQSANTATTLPPPDAGWIKIAAISVSSAGMLVLDVGANAVWRYEGLGAEYLNPPRFFFDSDVPNLTAAIDLFQNRDELFVLNQDGHMILCTYSSVETTPTRCKDPYPYQMAALNQPAQEVIVPAAKFERMQLTQPPEPSIYFLDSSSPAVYQFSLVLNFVSQLRPNPDSKDLPKTAPTGFVVTGGRNLVVAYGSQIFSAPLPAP